MLGQSICLVALDDIKKHRLAAHILEMNLAKLNLFLAESAQEEMIMTFDDSHFVNIVDISDGISSGVRSKFILNHPQTFFILDEERSSKGIDHQLSEHIRGH